MPWRNSIKDYALAVKALAIAIVLVLIRWGMWELGIEGLKPTVLFSSIIGGAVFILGLLIAGTMSDYNTAERAPAEMSAGLHAILRESEQMARVWNLPDMARLRERLVAVVDGLRRDIDAGNSRQCLEAIEDLSESFMELDGSDVPANYIVRLRQEQAGLRKTALRVYHIQREEFLPSAYAMIVSFIVVILGLIMFTRIESIAETLLTVFTMTFFFAYLILLLNVINTPLKVGAERGDDDVSLFELYEFVVYAKLADAGLSGEEVVAIAEKIEEKEGTAELEPEGEASADAGPVDIAEVMEAATEEAAAEGQLDMEADPARPSTP